LLLARTGTAKTRARAEAVKIIVFFISFLLSVADGFSCDGANIKQEAMTDG
jgi:hypothetical protein